MSIFGDSTPDFDTPVEDTVEETADIQEETEEVTEETTEEVQDSQEEHSQELLAGKYKSVDELVKGYKNLETMIGQKQPAQQPVQQQQPQVDYNDLFISNFNENPLGTIQHLVSSLTNQQMAPILEARQQEALSKSLGEVAKEYKQIGTEDGMAQYRTKIQEIAGDLGNPQLAQNPSPRVLKMAAMELWGDSNAQTFKNATEQGRIDAENTRKAKLGLNVAVSKKPQETPKTEADLILEGMRIHSGKKSLFG